MNVVILGASPKPDRYSHKAQLLLMEADHTVFPVSLGGGEILGVDGYSSIAEITEEIDTITLYVGPALLAPMLDEVIAASPRRIIFNPGTEESALMARCADAGIDVLEACTLVLLGTGQF